MAPPLLKLRLRANLTFGSMIEESTQMEKKI